MSPEREPSGETLARSRRTRPLAATAAMSSNSFAYNEQSGGGEAAELGQEATSTISPSGAFGLFSSDWKK